MQSYGLMPISIGNQAMLAVYKNRESSLFGLFARSLLTHLP